jgi:hypothetical protein
MTLDLANRHAARVHRHDLVVEAGKPALVALDQLRIECAFPIARNANRSARHVRRARRSDMEGSVRKVGDTITINAQLISTETGAHVWADRFEGDRSKLGALQVEAVSRLANSLGVELVKAEALRAARERPNNPDAVDLEMRGSAAYQASLDQSTVNEVELIRFGGHP